MNLGFEERLWGQGEKVIFGLDEVGRGPLAGPVVACAGCMSQNILISDEILALIDDSKKLTHKKREIVLEKIKDIDGIDFSIALIEHDKIDKINILQATFEAFRKASNDLEKKIGAKPDILLVDGNKTIPGMDGLKQQAIVQGDGKVLSIALASIVAKEYRDNLMAKYAQKYPNYELDVNKGYGTKKHIESIKKFGICEIHRKTFCKNFI